MKKILYIILLGLSSALTITSCTEEEIKPTTSTDSGGGQDIDPK